MTITLEAISATHLHFVQVFPNGLKGRAGRAPFGALDTIPVEDRPPVNTVSTHWNSATYTLTCTLDDNSVVTRTYDPADIETDQSSISVGLGWVAPSSPINPDPLNRKNPVIPSSGTTYAIDMAYFKTGELVVNTETGKLLIATSDDLGEDQTWIEFASVVI
jgi:hypothetical protein